MNPFGWGMKQQAHSNNLDDDSHGPSFSPQANFSPDRPHCAYCLCDCEDCLVRCPATGKYFCNGKGKAQHSHIVHHLIKSRNKIIQLPESNQYSKIPLCCYFCQTQNIFQLSFVQSLVEKKFFIVCRDCLSAKKNFYKFDSENTHSIIHDKSILPWLVRQPTDEEAEMAFKLSLKDIDLLEDSWEKDPNYTLMDLPLIKEKSKIPFTSLTYNSPKSYADVFNPLIMEESNYEKKMKESFSLPNISVDWSRAGPREWIARFVSNIDEANRNMTVAEIINISFLEFSENGKIISNQLGTIEAKFRDIPEPPATADPAYTVKLVFDDTSYKRQKAALAKFKNNSNRMNQTIKNIFLGNIPNVLHKDNIKAGGFNIPGLYQLNKSQIEATQAALELPFTLIQGPPGTGKTTVIAALVYKFLQLKKGPVLVCGPSNASTEHATQYCSLTGVNVIRVVSKKQEDLPSKVEELTLTNIIFHLDDPDSRRLNQLNEKSKNEPLTTTESNEFQTLKDKLEIDVISKADVICCTCDTAGSRKLADVRFPVVIVDEATQSVETKALISIMHDCQQVVLVGDLCQLGPNVMSRKAQQAGYGISIFQRLNALGLKPFKLITQYRMHPSLAEFPSNYFYDGILENGVSAQQRTPKHRVFPFPKIEYPMIFYNSSGREESSDSGTSFINRQEAYMASQIISKLCKAGVEPRKIGVITPYAGQKCYIEQFLSSAGDLPMDYYKSIQVASVDSFQGGERDYIILSCVRSNTQGHIGFLSDKRRINVSLTRAKMGLMILGSAETLTSNSMWYELLLHYQDKELIVEGTNVDKLQPSAVILQPPVVKSQKQPKRKGTRGKNMVDDPMEDDNDFEQNNDYYSQN